MKLPHRLQFQPSFFGRMRSEWLSLRFEPDDDDDDAGGCCGLRLMFDGVAFGFDRAVAWRLMSVIARGAEGRSVPQASQVRNMLGFTSVQIEQGHVRDEVAGPVGLDGCGWTVGFMDELGGGGRSRRV